MQKLSKEFVAIVLLLILIGGLSVTFIQNGGENYLKNLAQTSSFSNPVLVGSPTSASFVDTGLSPSTTYTYTVEAVDTAGNVSAPSNPISVTTLAFTPPPPPPPPPPPAPTATLTSSASTVQSGGSATLTWSSTNATTCTASGGWTGTKAISGSQSTGVLSATKTFTLACTGAGGTVTKNVSITVQAPIAPTVTLTTSASAVQSGGSATLTWSSTNATTCMASGGWTGTKAITGTQSTGALTATKIFTLTCTGSGGNAVKNVTVTVTTPTPPPPPQPTPTVTLTSSASTVQSGGSATLTWSSTNATTCTASGGWTGVKANSGTFATGALTTTKTFTLTCTGVGGSASDNVSITVQAAPAPTATLTSSAASVTSGGSATLTWSSTYATTCTASGGWTGTRTTSGSQSTGALTSSDVFTITCTGAGGSVTQNVAILIPGTNLPPPPPPTTTPPPPPTPVTTTGSYPPELTFVAVPSRIPAGQGVTLNWVAQNATGCQASGGWSGGLLESGSVFSSNVRQTTTYTITCSGPYGSATQSLTVEVLADSLSPNVSMADSDTPTPRTLSLGVIGEDVRKLQRFLILKRYLEYGNDNGRFGYLTERAVQEFQRAYSIVSQGTPETTGFGVVGAATLSKIQNEGGNIVATPTQNNAVIRSFGLSESSFQNVSTVTPPPSVNPATYVPPAFTPGLSSQNQCANAGSQITQNIAFGSTGNNVFILQCKLIKLRYLGAGNAIGIYGPKTLQAVKNLQCNQFITACSNSAPGYGLTGPKTRRYLNLQN